MTIKWSFLCASTRAQTDGASPCGILATTLTEAYYRVCLLRQTTQTLNTQNWFLDGVINIGPRLRRNYAIYLRTFSTHTDYDCLPVRQRGRRLIANIHLGGHQQDAPPSTVSNALTRPSSFTIKYLDCDRNPCLLVKGVRMVGFKATVTLET